MSAILQPIGSFFTYALLAVFAQNAIFTRALGVSRLVKLADDPTVSSFTFGILLCAVQLISAPLAYLANMLLTNFTYRSYFRPLVLVLCSCIAFFIVLLIVALISKNADTKNAVAVLPMATFNTCILGTLLINATQNFTLLQSIGFSLGSGIGYLMAVLVVREANEKLDHADLPNTFRGLPIILLYIGILSLAIYGFTGHMLSF